jgi:hypothetical protein
VSGSLQEIRKRHTRRQRFVIFLADVSVQLPPVDSAIFEFTPVCISSIHSGSTSTVFVDSGSNIGCRRHDRRRIGLDHLFRAVRRQQGVQEDGSTCLGRAGLLRWSQCIVAKVQAVDVPLRERPCQS